MIRIEVPEREAGSLLSARWSFATVVEHAQTVPGERHAVKD